VSTGLPSIKDSERLRVGIFLERRHIAHPWQEHAWHAAGIAPGAPELATPRLLQQGPGWARYHMATLDIELFPRETEGYRYNLSQQRPVVYVLWRHADEDLRQEPAVFHVTVCPYEAQDYLDGGDVMVEGVPIPDLVAHWMRGYIARHHVDAPFEKRRRKRHAPTNNQSGEPAIEEDEFG
jgi:hypothetical protein